MLAECGLTVDLVGTDISERALGLAAPNYRQTLRWDLDGVEDPLGGQVFDVVVCTEVLEHVFRPLDALRKLRAHLAPGGRMVVSFPNFAFWRNRWVCLRGEFPEELHIFDSVDELHYFTLSTFSRMVAQAGLVRRSLRPLPDYPAPFRLLPGRVRTWIGRRWPTFFGFAVLLVLEQGETAG